MTAVDKQSAAACDAETYALEAAEAAFILEAQMEIQKLLSVNGMRSRELAARLGVTEARVSQMLGDAAKNLTLKTIVRIFHQFGEKPHLTTKSEFCRHVVLGPNLPVEIDHWTVTNLPADLQTTGASREVPIARSLDADIAATLMVSSWAQAEEAVAERPRRTASGR
jgi:predicted XRE-type DNA-binding protein